MMCKAHTCETAELWAGAWYGGLVWYDCSGIRALAKGTSSHLGLLPLFSRKATLADIVEQLQEKEAGPGLPAGVVS